MNIFRKIKVFTPNSKSDLIMAIQSWSVGNTDDGHISNWDVSNVNNMQGMFSNSEKFNQHLSKWNVSNVMDMSFMFENATIFNGDISRWNVSNVIHMQSTFENATAFKPSDTQNGTF